MGLPEILLYRFRLQWTPCRLNQQGSVNEKSSLCKCFYCSGILWRLSGTDAGFGMAFRKQLERYILDFDHWFAFVLLGFLGGKMIVDVIRGAAMTALWTS